MENIRKEITKDGLMGEDRKKDNVEGSVRQCVGYKDNKRMSKEEKSKMKRERERERESERERVRD